MIGSEGAVQLASALVHNQTLTTLNLRSNAIQDAGGIAIAQARKRAQPRATTRLCGSTRR
eukprot:244591-Pleurochrysis_carterae.AAC.1